MSKADSERLEEEITEAVLQVHSLHMCPTLSNVLILSLTGKIVFVTQP